MRRSHRNASYLHGKATTNSVVAVVFLSANQIVAAALALVGSHAMFKFAVPRH